MAPQPVTMENLARLDTRAPAKTEGEDARSVKSGATLSQRAKASMHSMVIGSMVAVHGEPPRLPTEKRKPALSLTTTSVNFRGFVQKSGPVFYVQDSIESTLMWDDWPWSVMWMALNPRLLLCAAPAVLIVILCRTYFVRFPLAPVDTDASPGDALRTALLGTPVLNEEPRRPPVEPRPVREGELKYFSNMRDIQNMMRLIIDGYDHIAPLVKYLNWSDMPRTLRLLQASVAAMVLLYFVGPYIPLRLTLLVVGEGALLANHPWVKPALAGIHKHLGTGPAAQKRVLRKRRLMQRVMDLLDEDRLPESVWERGWRDVELFENQRFRSGMGGRGASERFWTSEALLSTERRPWTRGSDGFTPANEEDLGVNKHSILPEEGYEWIDDDDWRIDWGGAWSSVGVDANGFLYTDHSWQNPAPHAYGTDAQAPRVPARLLDGGEDTDEEEEARADMDALDVDEIGPKYRAVTRRRRWLRRAVRKA